MSHVSAPFADGLGAIAHGPCVLSTGPGIGIGLRCVFAYYEGLLLSFEVKAIGQAARDAHDSDHLPAGRGGRGRSGRAGGRGGTPERPRLPHSSVQIRVPDSAAGTTPDGQPWLRLEHHLDSRSHTGRGYIAPTPATATSPGTPLIEGVPAFVNDIDLWWPDLPGDARLPIEAGWPELGAPMTTTVLTLANLDRLEEYVVRL